MRPAAERVQAAQSATVLVIDDSEVAREHIKDLLSEAGYRVLTLASPIGASRAILSNRVDIVVIDVLMPGMRGDRLATLFRSNPRFESLGVVLISGESTQELEGMLDESGAGAIVSKADLGSLVGEVRRLLRAKSFADARRV